MSKQAISVTLAAENLLWLKGRAHAAGARSLSAMLDDIVSAARAGGYGRTAGMRSVVGTVDVSPSDPDLLGADAAIRALFPAPSIAEGTVRYARPRRESPARRQRRRTR